MKKYFNVCLTNPVFKKGERIEEIHISVKNEILSERTFIGTLIHTFGPSRLSEIFNTNTIIYIDDILEADSESILNPGYFALYIKGLLEDSSKKWKIILTKSIECQNE